MGSGLERRARAGRRRLQALHLERLVHALCGGQEQDELVQDVRSWRPGGHGCSDSVLVGLPLRPAAAGAQVVGLSAAPDAPGTAPWSLPWLPQLVLPCAQSCVATASTGLGCSCVRPGLPAAAARVEGLLHKTADARAVAARDSRLPGCGEPAAGSMQCNCSPAGLQAYMLLVTAATAPSAQLCAGMQSAQVGTGRSLASHSLCLCAAARSSSGNTLLASLLNPVARRWLCWQCGAVERLDVRVCTRSWTGRGAAQKPIRRLPPDTVPPLQVSPYCALAAGQQAWAESGQQMPCAGRHGEGRASARQGAVCHTWGSSRVMPCFCLQARAAPYTAAWHVRGSVAGQGQSAGAAARQRTHRSGSCRRQSPGPG